jgi:ABC-type branched-subunit amino acid transport system ATPase component
MTLLEIQGLTRDFGGVRAIDGLDLDVDAGEIVSVSARTVPGRRPCSTSSPA